MTVFNHSSLNSFSSSSSCIIFLLALSRASIVQITDFLFKNGGKIFRFDILLDI